eukprot:3207338-Rhodomonas_salina.1
MPQPLSPKIWDKIVAGRTCIRAYPGSAEPEVPGYQPEGTRIPRYRVPTDATGPGYLARSPGACSYQSLLLVLHSTSSSTTDVPHTR